MSDLSESGEVDLVAEEILEELRLGQKPSLDDYVAKYPDLATELRDLFPSLLLMEHFGSPDISGGLPNGETTSSGRRKLGDYVIVREIGRGGMGIVYEAEQQSLGRRVALKVLSARSRFNPHQIKRFDREARSVARLEHPGIVPVYGVGNDRGIPFYVMKLINGQGLDQVLTELRKYAQLKSDGSKPQLTEHALSAVTYALTHGVQSSKIDNPQQSQATTCDHAASVSGHAATPPDEQPAAESLDASANGIAGNSSGETGHAATSSSADADTTSGVFPQLSAGGVTSRQQYHRSAARIGTHVARSLHYAHEHGVLHRDIKPSNLMLDVLGHVWVTDFGLAKINQEEDITHTGEFVGTLRYTSPEQLRGWSDPRSDVYSLGITLYEMLCFRPAFPENDRTKLIAQIAHEEPKPIRSLANDVARDLETIVHKAIAKEPSLRYDSAEAFAADLERYLEDKPILARPTSVQQHIRLWARRKPAVAALSSLLVISLVVALFSVSWLWRRSEQDKRKAILAVDARQQALVEAKQTLARAEAASETLAEIILSGDPNQTGNYAVHQMLLDYEERLGESLREYPKLEAKLRHAVGSVFHSRNELSKAEINLNSALRLFAKAGLADSLEAARTRELLANVYRLSRDNESAARQLRQVIDIRTERLGAMHPETLQSRVFWLAAQRVVQPSVITNAELVQGFDRVAESLMDRLDDDQCAQVFLHARFYAITALNRLGRFDISEKYCAERLKLQRRLFGDKPNHPSIIYTLQQQAEVKRRRKRFGDSIAILRDAQDRARKWFDGEVSPQEVDMIIEEAKTHAAAADYESMESAARRAFDLSQEYLPPDNPLVRDSARFLAESLIGLGRADEAASIRSQFPIDQAR